jgi:hypothetical protein
MESDDRQTTEESRKLDASLRPPKAGCAQHDNTN